MFYGVGVNRTQINAAFAGSHYVHIHLKIMLSAFTFRRAPLPKFQMVIIELSINSRFPMFFNFQRRNQTFASEDAKINARTKTFQLISRPWLSFPFQLTFYMHELKYTLVELLIMRRRIVPAGLAPTITFNCKPPLQIGFVGSCSRSGRRLRGGRAVPAVFAADRVQRGPVFLRRRQPSYRRKVLALKE